MPMLGTGARSDNSGPIRYRHCALSRDGRTKPVTHPRILYLHRLLARYREGGLENPCSAAASATTRARPLAELITVRPMTRLI